MIFVGGDAPAVMAVGGAPLDFPYCLIGVVRAHR